MSNSASLLRRLLPIVVVCSAIALVFLSGAHQWLSLSALKENREWLLAHVHSNPVSAATFFVLLYALVVALSIPGALIMSLAGGFLFGTWLGGALVVAGATSGAVAIFLIARTALGELLREKAGPWLTKMEEGFKEDALSYLLVLRLVPLFPFWLVNLVPAFLGVSVATYTLATFVGVMPGCFVYASVGNGLGAVFDAGDDPNLSIITQPEIIGPIIGLAFLAMIPVVYKRIKRTRTVG